MKDTLSIKERVQELHQLINLHAHNYHSLDKPTIEDHEYDALFNELLELEEKFPEYLFPVSTLRLVAEFR